MSSLHTRRRQTRPPRSRTLFSSPLNRHVLTACVSVLALLPGCGGSAASDGPVSPPAQATATVSGTVVEQSSRAPLSGATVRLGSASATTDTAGRFVITNVVLTSAAALTVTLRGYDDYSATVSVPAGGTTQVVSLRRQTIFPASRGAVYIPAGTTRVRAVLVHMLGIFSTRGTATGITPTGVDPQLLAVRTALLPLAERQGIALVGFDPSAVTDFSALVTEVLSEVATSSGRDDLLTAPYVFFGVSAGATRAWSTMLATPERTAAFVLYVPSVLADSLPPALRTVPGLIVTAQRDTIVDNAVTVARFSSGRGAGAPWALGEEPGAGHGQPTAAFLDLFTTWLDATLQRRVSSTGAPTLAVLPETSGWLGDLTSFSVAAWTDFSGDRRSASWFASQTAADHWRNFVAR